MRPRAQAEPPGIPPGAGRVLDLESSPARFGPGVSEEAVSTLEAGGIVLFSGPAFRLTDQERRLLEELPAGSQKDVQNGRPTLIFDPERGRISGRPRLPGLDEFRSLLDRYASWAADLVERLLPAYSASLVRDRVTYRPVPRNKPQGLHVDASYLRPHRGRAMLRVFCNINPVGEPRVWRVGEDAFESFARRFLPAARTGVPARVRLVDWFATRVGLADRRATACDHLMADLRAQAKSDDDFQTRAPQRVVSFPAGSAWIAFTDLLLHGAVSGRHSVDRAFFLPADAMRTPACSSLRTLERLTGRDLERG